MLGNRETRPMKDYNKASSMQQAVIENGLENSLVLDKNLKLEGDKLTIGDLGCSHGKNSMIAINQLLDLVEKNEPVASNLKKLLVYHEDLEDNDFDQVQQCLDDKSTSYLNHSLITSKNIKTQVEFLRKPFYLPLFDRKSIDIIMCYTAIHWLPRYKNLTKGIWFLEQYETPENVEWYKNLGKACLLEWLNLRYEELRPNGLITMNIFESGSFFHWLNESWDDYLLSKGFSHSDLDKVNLAQILRSPSDLQECLNEVKDKFKVLRNQHLSQNYVFAKNHFRAMGSEQIFHGLSQYPNIFPTPESKNNFIEGYFDHHYTVMKFPEETYLGFIYLVLQKI